MEEPGYIAIRSIQHYLYCPHRWGLMEIDCAWAENYFVVKANLAHERVHSTADRLSRGKKVYTAVNVWNDDWGLYGELDCLEEAAGAWTIVEHKPTQPKSGDHREEDVMQVFAQKLCVDSLFGCDCDAAIYYTDVRRRVPVRFPDDLATRLSALLSEMRSFKQQGVIPPVRNGQNCSGCSMKDLCLPTASKKPSYVKNALFRALEEDV